jgi:PAS domain S-box-containing protein
VLKAAIEKNLSTIDFILKESGEKPGAALEEADLFVIGPEEKEPVKKIQEVNAVDRFISIIVLTQAADFVKTKQSIQFAPFVGKNSVCIALGKLSDLELAFKNAAVRTKQRRGFSRISTIPKPSTSIASTSVHVENLGIFLEKAPIAAFLLDEQDHIIATNQKAKLLFNIDENRNHSLKDFLPALSVQQLKRSNINKEKTETIVQSTELFLELNLSEVITDEARQLYILLVNDITEQKKKETALIESEALFRFMAEAIPQKVWTANANGELNFFNQRWIEYSGLSLEQLMQGDWVKTIHPDDLDNRQSVWQESIVTGKNFEFEQRLMTQSGEYRWHLVRGISRKDKTGKVVMWVGTNTDIQEQVAFKEELEKRVKERTIELEKTNNELEQFVFVTSHDLQEPMRKIRMFSELMIDASNDMDPTALRYLGKISSTALRMSTLLKELLNFTQLSREEQLEATDLKLLVEQILVDLELMIQQKQAEIITEDLPEIFAVPVQMQQLFYNLIYNALKFAKEGVQPVVTIRAALMNQKEVQVYPELLPDKNYYHFIVEDNGIGFDPAYAEQIFHIFQQLHNRNSFGGTGIGLALCKKVVNNHHGHIHAESAPGAGSKFHVILPEQ